jgi:hypothetical protein
LDYEYFFHPVSVFKKEECSDVEKVVVFNRISKPDDSTWWFESFYNLGASKFAGAAGDLPQWISGNDYP